MGGSFFSVLKVGLLSESVGTPSGVWKIYPHFLNTAGDGRPLYPGGAGRISPVVAVILRFPFSLCSDTAAFSEELEEDDLCSSEEDLCSSEEDSDESCFSLEDE